MAPRRTAAKTAVVEAAEFDFEAFLGDFERPEFTRQLFRKGKLRPKLDAMTRDLDDLDARIERLERAQGEDGGERDITAVDPLAELERRREALTLEFNDLANEYNASAVDFTFRVPDQQGDNVRIKELMDEAGLVQPEKPETADTGDAEADDAANSERLKQFDADFAKWWDGLAVRSMMVTCVSHEFTLEQWQQLRARVGEVAFSSLAEAWFQAVQAAAPNVPFSLRPSHTPIRDE